MFVILSALFSQIPKKNYVYFSTTNWFCLFLHRQKICVILMEIGYVILMDSFRLSANFADVTSSWWRATRRNVFIMFTKKPRNCNDICFLLVSWKLWTMTCNFSRRTVKEYMKMLIWFYFLKQSQDDTLELCCSCQKCFIDLRDINCFFWEQGWS